MREIEDRYAASGKATEALYRQGDLDAAMKLHLMQEHPISHELDAAVKAAQDGAVREMVAARATFDSDQALLSSMMLGVSLASIVLALISGFVFSWALVRPVTQI